jgi:hypothetical protein
MDTPIAELPSRPSAGITAAAGDLSALSLAEVTATLQLVLAVRRHARLADDFLQKAFIANAA